MDSRMRTRFVWVATREASTSVGMKPVEEEEEKVEWCPVPPWRIIINNNNNLHRIVFITLTPINNLHILINILNNKSIRNVTRCPSVLPLRRRLRLLWPRRLLRPSYPPSRRLLPPRSPIRLRRRCRLKGATRRLGPVLGRVPAATIPSRLPPPLTISYIAAAAKEREKDIRRPTLTTSSRPRLVNNSTRKMRGSYNIRPIPRLLPPIYRQVVRYTRYVSYMFLPFRKGAEDCMNTR